MCRPEGLNDPTRGAQSAVQGLPNAQPRGVEPAVHPEHPLHLHHRAVPSAVEGLAAPLQSAIRNPPEKKPGKIQAFCVTGRWHGAPRLGRRSWITLGQEGRQRGALRGHHAQPRGVGSAMQPLISAAMLIRRGRQSDWPPHPPCPRSSLTLGRARQGPFRRGPARRHRPGRARPEPVQAGPRSAASHVWSFVGARDPSGRRRLSSVSYRTLSAFLGPCTVIPSPAGGPGARAGPTARGAAARARRPPYAVLRQAGGRQAKHRHHAGQAGAGQARTRQGRPAQASRSSS